MVKWRKIKTKERKGVKLGKEKDQEKYEKEMRIK